jgi:serine phosphatase RsbU (regulator of sigma subunit)/Tfp pilus assembly protein PilF
MEYILSKKFIPKVSKVSLIIAFVVIPFLSKSQSVDSIELKLTKYKADTSFLRKSLIELQKAPLMGTKKADSLVQLILGLSKTADYHKGIALSYMYLGRHSFIDGNYSSAIVNLKKSIEILNVEGDSSNIALANQFMASSYKNLSKLDTALILCTKSIYTFQSLKDYKNLSSSYNTLGGIYWSKGDFSKAAEVFYKSLEIKVQLGDSLGIANTYNNIGILYDSQQKLPEALEMYNKSYEIYKKKGMKRGIGRACNNIAIVLKNLNKCGEAVEMLLRSLEIDKELGNLDDQAKTLNNIGQLYIQMNNGTLALNYFKDALEIFSKNKNINGETAAIINFGRAYFLLGNYGQAQMYFAKGLSYSKAIKSAEFTKESYDHLYEVNKKLGNISLALRYHELSSSIGDSLRSIENLNKIDELKIKYESELKETEITLLNKDNLIKNLEIDKQRAINWFLVSLLVVVIVLFSVVCFGWMTKRKDNQKLQLKNEEISQQKEEIEAQRDQLQDFNITLNEQNDEILTQRDLIETKNTIISASNRRLTENIEYASRIQSSLLPDLNQLNGFFTNHYIIYKPKDIVSGDFYWMHTQDDRIYFSVADCTGHGVSGAFMSILAFNYLKDSIITKGLSNPKEIISFISNEVEYNLYNNLKRNEVKDGMDLIVCCYDIKSKILEFSGAHSSFYHIRNNSLECYKTDRYSIGSRINNSTIFTNHQIQLQEGDRLVFFTDGYMDQLSQDRKSKIGGANFKSLIQDVGSLSLSDQKQRIERFFDTWKGDYEQIDDVLIFCLEV